jgi:hypothetical protein
MDGKRLFWLRSGVFIKKRLAAVKNISYLCQKRHKTERWLDRGLNFPNMEPHNYKLLTVFTSAERKIFSQR